MTKKSGYKLVVVESPTKAKTIRRFLGPEYIVESCMGHVRDLPQSAKDIPEKLKKEKWAQLGVNVEKNFEPLYCIPKDKAKVVKNLKEKLEEAQEFYLATDEDREGESISWHLVEILKPKVPTKRMVFHEITKEAIQKSLKDTRSIDFNLVRAQEARRVLDRLVGYTISPLLWKKVAYGLSAGRVQSVAVRLIVEREHERIRFKKSSYWGLTAQVKKTSGGSEAFEARLIEVQGKRIATGKDFDGLTGKLAEGKQVVVLGETQAIKIKEELSRASWSVSEIEEKPLQRRPAPPFITSTLQQEANRKMGLGSRETMQVAQKLYEQGFITYMRTDSTFLSAEALQAARTCIEKKYGKEYLPPQPRFYEGKKAKGAQEAHEAIRPAGSKFVDPDETGLSGTQFRLYEMIWMRTMASQMVDARQKQVSAKLTAGNHLLSSSGMTIEFPGFLRAYVEGSDDPESELADREVRLPPLKVKESLFPLALEPTSHETKPPARYTEASLVQTMEKEGIGRPSTYASVIGTIVDRGYVRKQGTSLVPTFTALVVSKLLKSYLPEYVDLGFTSGMEESLDHIAEGDLNWESYLKKIYLGPKGLRSQVEIQEEKIDPEDARTIKLEGLEKFSFHVGRYGAYLSTQREGEKINASLPDSESPADLTSEVLNKLVDQKIHGSDSIGKDPKTGLSVYVLSGRFGPYVQLGEVGEGDKPKRSSIPAGMEPSQIDLPKALELLSLPKALGLHPGTQKEVKVGLGRFGPFVVHEGDYRSIPKGENLFGVNFKRALELLSQPKKGRGKASPLKILGKWPGTDHDVQVFNGPYGPYIKVLKSNASVPEGVKVEDLSLALAIEVLKDKVKIDSKVKKQSNAKIKSPRPSLQKSEKKPKEFSKTSVAKKPQGSVRIEIKKSSNSSWEVVKTAASSKNEGTSKLRRKMSPHQKAKILKVSKVVGRKKF